jgi:NitT/TauT family transport system ATP-binding protein
MIEVKNITKVFPDELGINRVLLNDISFIVPDEQITSIITPEFAGKSTLLKIIAGLENPTGGSIMDSSGGSKVFIPSLPSSFPWLNVGQNIMVGNKSKSNVVKSEFINLVGLEGYENYCPHNSSIGFRFRISLARALVQRPALVLLDDPFKLMKQESRKELYFLVKEINKTTKTAFLFATSNVTEALILSDRIILMKKGPLEIIQAQIPEIPVSEDWIFNDSENFRKIKNQIELFLRNTDLNR